MKKSNKIALLKLGGSLLTNKSKPFSIREDIVKNAVEQIINANEKVILIHGGGSFGHPLAKRFKISNGIDNSIPNQIFGLVETHHSMVKFNSYLINLFLERNYPVLSIQSSGIFIKNNQEISNYSIPIIESALGLNILPILYGDIIFDKQGSFSIISGDQIIFELCDNLKSYWVSKVIFAMEVDGLYVKGKNKDCVLINECYPEELESLELADLGQKIDVTGGIRSKLSTIEKVCKYNIPVQLINGIKEDYIYKSLKDEKLNCTNILIKI